MNYRYLLTRDIIQARDEMSLDLGYTYQPVFRHWVGRAVLPHDIPMRRKILENESIFRLPYSALVLLGLDLYRVATWREDVVELVSFPAQNKRFWIPASTLVEKLGRLERDIWQMQPEVIAPHECPREVVL